MFRAHQPVTQDFEETAQLHVGRRVEIGGKGTNRLFVHLEEQSVFRGEMLEDRSLGNVQFGGNIADPGSVIAVFGEMTHGGVDDPGALGFGARTSGSGLTVARGKGNTAGYTTHSDLKSL